MYMKNHPWKDILKNEKKTEEDTSLQHISNETSSWQGKFYYGNQNHKKPSGDSKWPTASQGTSIVHKLEDRQVDEKTKENSLQKNMVEDILVLKSPKNVFERQENFYYCGPNPKRQFDTYNLSKSTIRRLPKIQDIKKSRKNDLSINVFQVERDNIEPVKTSALSQKQHQYQKCLSQAEIW